MKSRMLSCLAALPLALAQGTTVNGLAADMLDLVQQNLASVSHKSWEMGVQAQALLELRYPAYSIFSPTLPTLSQSGVEAIEDVYAIVQRVISNRTANQLQLVEDAAVGDPASLGPAVLLASQMKGADNSGLMNAADDQLLELLSAPRSEAGAISHRTEQVQLWSDFVYMAPPFLAYYGLIRNNFSMLQEAARQCLLYADVLATEPGPWRHIMLGDWQDPGEWATGSAWAAAGQLRVVAAIQHSPYASDLTNEVYQLVDSVKSIIAGSWQAKSNLTHLLPNYMANDTDSNFSDAAGTALMAATTYRLAALGWDSTYIPDAEMARQVVQHQVDSYGWLHNVVDPMEFDVLGSESAEGQAFVLLLQASWSDWAEGQSLRIVDPPTTRRRRRSRLPFKIAKDVY